MIAFDTHLLVYTHRSGYAEHRAARRACEKATQDLRGWGIPLPCIAEFWNVVTHPSCLGGPSPAKEAKEFLQAMIVENGASVLHPHEGFWERLCRLAADLRVHGPRIFHLQIALTAFENGASEIWTHDRNFTTLPGLQVYDPL